MLVKVLLQLRIFILIIEHFPVVSSCVAPSKSSDIGRSSASEVGLEQLPQHEVICANL